MKQEVSAFHRLVDTHADLNRAPTFERAGYMTAAIPNPAMGSRPWPRVVGADCRRQHAAPKKSIDLADAPYSSTDTFGVFV